MTRRCQLTFVSMKGARATSPAAVFVLSRGLVDARVLEATGDTQQPSEHREWPERGGFALCSERRRELHVRTVHSERLVP